MTYEEYLELFKKLKTPNYNNELLNKLKNSPVNSNLQELLSEKYRDVIIYKFSESVKKIKSALTTIFDDINYLDIILVNFKKEIKYLKEMIDITILTPEEQQTLINTIKDETDKTYEILIKEANIEDKSGAMALIINNNRIKWSDNNEL